RRVVELDGTGLGASAPGPKIPEAADAGQRDQRTVRRGAGADPPGPRGGAAGAQRHEPDHAEQEAKAGRDPGGAAGRASGVGIADAAAALGREAEPALVQVR